MSNQKSATIYKCFIASPGDTEEERAICDKVFEEINKTIGNNFNFRIESVKWEDAVPDFGTEPQQVINKQLFNDIDLFIGIMYARFGTPTKQYNSGTEEEFYLALEQHMDEENINIMFYFNDAKISMDSINIEQLDKVKEFKKDVTEFGGLYKKYSGIEDFKNKISYDLTTLLSQKKNGDSDVSVSVSTLTRLQNKLDNALMGFYSTPTTWVAPVLYKPKKKMEEKETLIEISDIIQNPRMLKISAPTQFGLTCLSHHLVIEAWKQDKLWVRLDAAKPSTANSDIEKVIAKHIKHLGLNDKEADCIVLDSWKSSAQGSMKLLRSIISKYHNIPIILMNTMEDFKYPMEEDMKLDQEFEHLTLRALSRNGIRKIVSAYNNEKNIGDEDVVLDSVVKDLKFLNIHRTPSNCLMLLKISEGFFDDSPINRTEMVQKILFVLFDSTELSRYQTKPDAKDCGHILGYFCESLIKEDREYFDKKEFMEKSQSYCEQNYLTLDINVIFHILYQNNIIVTDGSKCRFKWVYWIYYFGSLQMHSDETFLAYVLEEKKYDLYPEIIEFYTGIDRKRQNIVDVLTQDLSEQCTVVEEKTGLNANFDFLDIMRWNPSSKQIEMTQKYINKQVQSSKLPVELKDKYSDRGYDYAASYNQNIPQILEEYSFNTLIQRIRASCRALRNSDYTTPESKKILLKEITRGWNLFSKILFLLAPQLMKNNHAGFDGRSFYLSDSFDHFTNSEEKLKAIILAIPYNVVRFFHDDFSSKRNGRLLYDAIASEKTKLIKHELILSLISTRSKDWNTHIHDYIDSIHRNSVYLGDLIDNLQEKYTHDFATKQERHDMLLLIKNCLAKNRTGNSRKIDGLKNFTPPKRLSHYDDSEDN